MDSDLKSRIEKLKQRRFPYKNIEGKWGYTDVFGIVVEPAHLDKVENNPYDIKGALELDDIPPLSHRELINKYSDFILPQEGKMTGEEIEILCEITEKIWPRENEEKETVTTFDNYSFIREDWGKRDIRSSHIIRYGIKGFDPLFITECIYDNVYPFKEGLGRVYQSYLVENYPQYWMINLGIDYLWVDTNIDGLNNKCPTYKYEDIMEEGWYGFINNKGKEVIPCEYYEARDFSDGVAAVAGKGGWGYIDKNNNVVIPFFFEDADDFIDGFARVLHAGNFYIIDKEGFCYESYEEIQYGLGSKFYLEDTELL